MYKPSRIHVVVNALSRLLDFIEPTSVFDQTTNAHLFSIDLKLLKDVKEFLKTIQIEGTLLVQ